MAIKPILFNSDMVRAILGGRKSVTRRVIKPQPDPDKFGVLYQGTHKLTSKDAPYRPGDILYVRETWAKAAGAFECGWHYEYRADTKCDWINKWHPSIHMPREAARIWLRVTNVRVERLQEITDDGAKSEGAWRCFEYATPDGPLVLQHKDGYYTIGFKALWDSTIKPADRDRYGWAANPWVWVIEFERCEKPEEG